MSRINSYRRFSVLQRDNFTCQYCGRKAPDVVLEVDHKVPRSKGGGNEIENLITACQLCNSGKFTRMPGANEEGLKKPLPRQGGTEPNVLADVPDGTITAEEIIAKSYMQRGAAWNYATLKEWGVPVPPPKGWRFKLTKKDVVGGEGWGTLRLLS